MTTDQTFPAVEAALFRQVLGHFCSGIVVITSRDDDGPIGVTCQSFSSLSLEPPLVLFCPSRSSPSWQRVKQSGRFTANVLAHDQTQVSTAFATSGEDKFAGVEWTEGASGAPVLAGALAHIDCVLNAVHDGGDHDIAVGRVLDLGHRADCDPLLFFRGGYRQIAIG